jgi:hypothetical protein
MYTLSYYDALFHVTFDLCYVHSLVLSSLSCTSLRCHFYLLFHIDHSFLHSSISYSLRLSSPNLISPHLFFPHSHPISPYLTLPSLHLSLPYLTLTLTTHQLTFLTLTSALLLSPYPHCTTPNSHPQLTLILTPLQPAHTRLLSAPLWTMRTVLAECSTLSSATSTVEEKRNITATSTRTTSRHLGSSPPSYPSSCSYSNSQPTFKASW